MKEESMSNSAHNSSVQTPSGIHGPRDGTITDLGAAKLLLDAWKFRQAHTWSAITKYFFAAAFISVIPYILNKELIQLLQGKLWIFPVLGGLMALAAVWLYAAEYIRAQSMSIKFREILENYGHYKKEEFKGPKKILRPEIGWFTVYILGAASILLAVINFLIVLHIPTR
jgi:hypothetical protein